MDQEDFNRKRRALKMLSHSLFIQDTEGEEAAMKFLEQFKKEEELSVLNKNTKPDGI